MKKQLYSLILLAFVGTACNSKLDPKPVNTITQEQMLEVIKRDPVTVLGGMVSNVNDYIRACGNSSVNSRNVHNLNLALDLKGNDMVYSLSASSTWFKDDYQLTNLGFRLASNGYNANYWQFFYLHIYTANKLLDLIPDFSTVKDANVVKTLKGYKAAGLTLRAYAYTYLMWLYQDDYLHGGKDKAGVPMPLKADNARLPRSSSAVVWAQIMADAKEAVQLFGDSGINPLTNTDDLDAATANLVLARAALTTGDWATAISAADAVMKLYPLMGESDYTTKGFGYRDVPEVILGYDYNKENSSSSFHGWMNILGTGGYGGSQGMWTEIDQRLYDQIAAQDYRKKCFLDAPMNWRYDKAAVDVTFPKYANMKFAAPKHQETMAHYAQDVIYMRASEAYLIKAEAEARGGNETAANATLTSLISARTNGAYTADTYPATVGKTMLEKVQLQTRIEMWGEGFEFYNNKRWGISLNRSTPASANHTATPTFNFGKDYTFQIPEGETNYNNIEQNP